MAIDGGVNEVVLEMWAVYNSPRDYPGQFVARMFVAVTGDPEPHATTRFVVAPTLEAVRSMLPWGLVCLARSEGDEAPIVETWL